MKKKYKYGIAAAVILVVILAIVFISRYLNRTLYNDELIYGTSPGNFYNGGLFCQANGYVYFSNPNDNFRLYRMNPDGSEPVLLSEDSCCYINADSHYLYYARSGSAQNHDFSFLRINSNSLCRVPIDGGEPVILDDAPTLYAILVQNHLYYIHYDEESLSTLYKIGIDGEDARKISSDPLLLSPGLEGTLCYNGVSTDHNIGFWNPQTDTGTTIYQGNCYLPIDTTDYIYFLNCEDDYTLHRYEKSTGSVTKLTDCRVDCYNLTDEYVYYQKNDATAPALCRLRLDGTSQEEIVQSGNFTDINVTSQYVYFSIFNSPQLVYQTPANGVLNVQGFSLQYEE